PRGVAPGVRETALEGRRPSRTGSSPTGDVPRAGAFGPRTRSGRALWSTCADACMGQDTGRAHATGESGGNGGSCEVDARRMRGLSRMRLALEDHMRTLDVITT